MITFLRMKKEFQLKLFKEYFQIWNHIPEK